MGLFKGIKKNRVIVIFWRFLRYIMVSDLLSSLLSIFEEQKGMNSIFMLLSFILPGAAIFWVVRPQYFLTVDVARLLLISVMFSIPSIVTSLVYYAAADRFLSNYLKRSTQRKIVGRMGDIGLLGILLGLLSAATGKIFGFVDFWVFVLNIYVGISIILIFVTLDKALWFSGRIARYLFPRK